jgi:Tol biopolymer transport system component
MRSFIFMILMCTQLLLAQTVSVSKITKMIQKSSGEFYYPKFNPDDTKILLTSENYKGLWIYDLNSKDISQLNYYNGSGYSSVFSEDGSKLIYRADEFLGRKKYSSLIIQEIKSGDETVIEQNIRNLSAPEILSNGQIFYTKDFNAGIFDHQTNQPVLKGITATVAYTENSNIALYSKEKKYLQPFGENHYIWVSISPQEDRILFTVPSKGTFISDLKGKILVELGYANAPKWSADGNFIAFMVDKDDGHQITGSEIFVATADGKQKFAITNTADIAEMHPNWSQSGNKLVFNSVNGEIFIAELNIEKKDTKNEIKN